MTDKTKPTRAAIDWERIELDYRAGVKSVREIGGEHGVSHTAINKRAKAEEWTRDLSAKIKAKADAKVSKALVSSEVAAETKITEAKVVEVESEVQARIRLAHRQDIAKSRALAMKLLGELAAVTDEGDLIEQLREALGDGEKPETKQRLYDAWQRVMALPSRTKTMRDLAETLRCLVGMEREAYGMETRPGGPADGLPLVTVKDLTGRK